MTLRSGKDRYCGSGRGQEMLLYWLFSLSVSRDLSKEGKTSITVQGNSIKANLPPGCHVGQMTKGGVSPRIPLPLPLHASGQGDYHRRDTSSVYTVDS